MLLHQSSSCHQFANDCDNKRVDNSNGDDHNDVDVRNCYCRDNIDNYDKLNDVDVRNCCWRDNCDNKRDVQHDKCICRRLNLNCSPLDQRHSILKRCT